MAVKSEYAVIEVLLKDETQHSNMTDIMNFKQDCGERISQRMDECYQWVT